MNVAKIGVIDVGGGLREETGESVDAYFREVYKC